MKKLKSYLIDILSLPFLIVGFLIVCCLDVLDMLEEDMFNPYDEY